VAEAEPRSTWEYVLSELGEVLIFSSRAGVRAGEEIPVQDIAGFDAQYLHLSGAPAAVERYLDTLEHDSIKQPLNGGRLSLAKRLCRRERLDEGPMRSRRLFEPVPPRLVRNTSN